VAIVIVALKYDMLGNSPSELVTFKLLIEYFIDSSKLIGQQLLGQDRIGFRHGI
jgi:hypothetical protein